jgi:hypothetical protein
MRAIPTTENQDPRTTLAHHFCLFVKFLLQIVEHIRDSSIWDSKGELEKVQGEIGQSNKYHTALGVAKPTKSGSILRSCMYMDHETCIPFIRETSEGSVTCHPREIRGSDTRISRFVQREGTRSTFICCTRPER